jgi:hypothetical protein
MERPSSQHAETAVLERLQRWRKAFGEPLMPGRDNPDNDMWYLLLDAENVITGLRDYAKHLEDAIAALHPKGSKP